MGAPDGRPGGAGAERPGCGHGPARNGAKGRLSGAMENGTGGLGKDMGESTIRSRYAMAGCTRTHYSEVGVNGPPVVLLHGGGPGSSGEAGFGPVMSLLAEDFTVYAPDGVGGYGDTDPYVQACRGAQSRVDQLEAFVDALCLDEFCLGGNSQGAWVAAKYALEHPDRVRKLFLIASGTISEAMGVPMPKSEGREARRGYDGTAEAMRRMMVGLVYNPATITDELLAKRQASANRPGAAESRRIYDESHARLGSDPRLRTVFDMRDRLPRLSIPATFIWGENDRFALPELGHTIQPMLPNFGFEWISKAGHQVQTDQPKLVAQLMRDFFRA